MARFAQHLSSQNDDVQFGGAGAHARLHAVNVNTKAASAVVTCYNGTSTSGDVIAVIDAATAAVCLQYEGLRCPAGLYVKMTGGAADVTITAE